MSETVKVKDRRHLIVLAVLCAVIVWLWFRRRGNTIYNAAPFTVSVPDIHGDFGPYSSSPVGLYWPGSDRWADTALCACGPCGSARKARQTPASITDPLFFFSNNGPTIDPVFLDEYQAPVAPRNPLIAYFN